MDGDRKRKREGGRKGEGCGSEGERGREVGRERGREKGRGMWE